MVEEAERPRKPIPNMPPLCTVHKDQDSYHYTVEAVRTPHTVAPSVEVWWNRKDRIKIGGRTVLEEYLVLRQEGDEKDAADVIVLLPGQVYDLIDALNRAAENP